MIKITEIFLIVISTLLLVVNQVLLKLWLIRKNVKVWPLEVKLFKNMLSYEVLFAIISLFISGLIWIYLLKKIPLSILYPFVSISYIFGLLAAKYIFSEDIPLQRWLGVILIIVGLIFVSRT
jgi:drug/metabolite transporter (DMT)-like permease